MTAGVGLASIAGLGSAAAAAGLVGAEVDAAALLREDCAGASERGGTTEQRASKRATLSEWVSECVGMGKMGADGKRGVGVGAECSNVREKATEDKRIQPGRGEGGGEGGVIGQMRAFGWHAPSA